jgi:CYTH domain-containing protein
VGLAVVAVVVAEVEVELAGEEAVVQKWIGYYLTW